MLQKVLSSRLIRFGAVGLIVTAFFMALNAVLSKWVGLSASVAFLVAYPPALVLHFTLNKLWTFGDSRSTSSRHLAEYLFSVLVTFLIQWPSFLLLQKGLRLPGWLAAGGANVVQMTASYAMLRWRVFNRAESASEGPAAESWHRLVLLLVTLGTSALIAWTALGKWEWPTFQDREPDAYNLLVSGFRKGSLAMDVSVPEELKNAADPWNPDTRPHVPYLHDASFYRGRYYLYFGVVPAVLLFWPFKALTGLALPFVIAPILYLVGANLVTAWLWLRIVRERFARAGLLTRLGGVVALGICGGQLSLARRSSLWEMPISGGYFYVTVMIAAAYLALTGSRPRTWLAVVGASLGLAVGCRPTLVAGGLGLALLVLVLGNRAGGPVGARLRRTLAGALSAGIPLGAIMAGLFAYNYARFGSPFEFGIKYQLNTNYEAVARHFRPAFFGFNLRAYFFSVPRFGRYFPFLHQPDLGDMPPGYYGTEFVYGVFIVCPVVLGMAFAVIPFLRRRADPLAAFTAYLGALALPVTAILLCFDTAAARYAVDFIPLLVWIALVGWASLEDVASGLGRTAGRAAFGVLVAASALVAFVLSLALHGVLVFNNPAAYLRISRAFNFPVAIYERIRGERYGELELDVRFPAKPSGSLEPLAVTGAGYESDYFFAFYRSDRIVQLGFENSGDSMLLSREIHYDPAQVYHVGLLSGSILPPEGHPVYTDWNEYDARALLNWVRIDLDGKPIINQERQSHEGAPELLQVGRDVRSAPFGRQFTGSITNVHRDSLHKAYRSPETHGDVILDVSLPSEVVDGAQPLVVAGRPGVAELIGYHTLDANHFALDYEYWGAGLWESPPIEVPADRFAHFRIRLGSILAPDRANPYYDRFKDSVIVWMNDKAVWWRKSAGPIDPNPKVEILANLIGSSAMRRSFQGVLRAENREAAPAWRPGPFRTLELYLGGRGSLSQPLVATGTTSRADSLAIVWLPKGRARLLYDHWGVPIFASADFDWDDAQLHHLLVQLPSFLTLDKAVPGDGVGRLQVTLDGKVVAAGNVQYFDAPSSSFVFGRNLAGSSVMGDRLDVLLGDIRQAN